ncbi:MAG: hypothetical protein GX197_10115 [Firmicutes bacterium]|nr:hypothetical protein [Bacillota bacterium]
MQVSVFICQKQADLRRKKFYGLFGLGLVVFVFIFWSHFNFPGRIFVNQEALSKIQIASSEYPYFNYTVRYPARKKLYYQQDLNQGTLVPPSHDYVFTLGTGQEFLFYYSPTFNKVYDRDYRQIVPSHELKEMLLDLIALYKQEAQKKYGELLVWEEVNHLFPKYATAKITDIYTGLSFSVQRREGSAHADVQPLTAADTAVMKKIYDGQWSWERRGIIVEVGGYRIAASMHGMPHGGGKIVDNDFPGHFCIHFLGSYIHGGGMDGRHHREILKAAGRLPLDHF